MAQSEDTQHTGPPASDQANSSGSGAAQPIWQDRLGAGWSALTGGVASIRPDWSQLNSANNGRYGSWVEKTLHQGLSNEYAQDWQAFFRQGVVTAQDAFDFGRQLAQKYGFDVDFQYRTGRT